MIAEGEGPKTKEPILDQLEDGMGKEWQHLTNASDLTVEGI